MLSNTVEKNHGVSVVYQEAFGSSSTGIIDAQSASDSRNNVPITVNKSANPGNTIFADTLAVTVPTSIAATIPARAKSMRMC